MMNPNPTTQAAPKMRANESPPDPPIDAAMALAHAQVNEKFPNPKRQKLNSLSAIGLGVNMNNSTTGGVGLVNAKGTTECLTTVRSSLSNSAFRSSTSSIASSPTTTTSSSLSRFLSNAVSNHLPPPPPQLQHHQHYNSISPSQGGGGSLGNQNNQQQQKPQERQWTIVKNTASQSMSSFTSSPTSSSSPSGGGAGQLNHLRISLQSSSSPSSSSSSTSLNTTNDPLKAKSVQQNSPLRKTESAPLRTTGEAQSPNDPVKSNPVRCSPKQFSSPQSQLKMSPLTTNAIATSSSVMNRSFSESSAVALSTVSSSSLSLSSSSPSSNPKSFQPSPTAPPTTTRITPTITPVVKDETAMKRETPRMPTPQRSIDSSSFQSSSKEPNNNKLIKSLSQPPQPQLVQQQLEQPVAASRTSPTAGLNHSQPQSSTQGSQTAPQVVQPAPRKSFACLRNLGSTCYINCIIQVMRYTPGFVLSIHKLHRQIEYLKSMVSVFLSLPTQVQNFGVK